tara:strand:+ start:105764 stop:106027 length:264 start_codon:yes stop_codon:yes gene_type:complete
MDRNKAITLGQIDYRLQSACGLCAHGNFNGQTWGTCNKHSYKHEKHTGDVRQLSIHFTGVCPDFERCEVASSSIEHYAPFFKDTSQE